MDRVHRVAVLVDVSRTVETLDTGDGPPPWSGEPSGPIEAVTRILDTGSWKLAAQVPGGRVAADAANDQGLMAELRT